MITKHMFRQIWSSIICILVLCSCTIELQHPSKNNLSNPMNALSPKEGTVRLYTTVDQTYISKSSLDFSTGNVTSPDIGDIQFTVSRGGGGSHFYALEPINGSKSHLFGDTNPGFDGCNHVFSKLATGAIPEILIGNYMCIATEQGLFAQIEIRDMNLNEGWIKIKYEVLKD